MEKMKVEKMIKISNPMKAAIIIIVVGIIAILAVNMVVDFPKDTEEQPLFPGIIGDMILKSNDTGIYFIKNMTLYDDFRGDITQGFKANYSGKNGTMIIFIAQMSDNQSANKALKDMIIRNGYNESMDSRDDINGNITRYANDTIMKLPVKNPEVFIMQKDKKVRWHYTFAKLDKVYWVGFSESEDTYIEYQVNMLIEVYRYVDKIKNGFDE